MSMLAEPRRKQKISLDPRNTQWSKDGNKIGQKLMEKMGWESGSGLGAKQDGMKEHIKIAWKDKDDTRGVGCSKNYADNWIAHQDDFNSLLSSLKENHNAVNSQAESEGEPDVQQLEKASKTSKGRVHYGKFTRGKDLSRAKTEDLNSIFGRKKKDGKPASRSDDDKTEPKDGGSLGYTEENKDSSGVKTFTNSMSVQDYFALKMAALKQAQASKLSENSSASQQTTIDNLNEMKEDTHFKEEIEIISEDTTKETCFLKQKKKKTKRKSKLMETNMKYSVRNTPLKMEIQEEGNVVKKLDKKSKFFNYIKEEAGNSSETDSFNIGIKDNEEVPTKTKKLKKNKNDKIVASEMDIKDKNRNKFKMKRNGNDLNLDNNCDAQNVKKASESYHETSKKQKLNTVIDEESAPEQNTLAKSEILKSKRQDSVKQKKEFTKKKKIKNYNLPKNVLPKTAFRGANIKNILGYGQ